MFWITVLNQMSLTSINICGLLSPLAEQKFFILLQTSLSIIYFMDCTSGVASKMSLSCLRSSRFCPTLYSRSVVLCFKIRSVIHFELIFMKICIYSFFSGGCPVITALFVRKNVFFLLYYFCSFVKHQLIILFWVCFWLYSVQLIYFFSL